MHKRGSNVESPLKELLEYITPVLTIVGGGIGFLIAKFLEWKKLKDAQKEIEGKIENDDEKLENERFRDTITASQQLANVLMNVVEPLSKRIATLEEDALRKQKLIMDLDTKVVELTRTIRVKDGEIEDLNKRYLNQVEISNQQELKIQAQARRITELEDELTKLKKRKE